MPETLVINLDKPLKSATLADNDAEHSFSTAPQNPAADNDAQAAHDDATGTVPQMQPSASIRNIENQKAQLDRLCRTLDNLISDLNKFHEQTIAHHAEQIAKLSVEIARKILMQKVQQKDYEIETIVKESLKNAPTHNDIVVHLNPDDLAQYQKFQEAEHDSTIADIKFVADTKIEPAQCLIETPKGIVKSFIEEHLARIEEALVKVK